MMNKIFIGLLLFFALGCRKDYETIGSGIEYGEVDAAYDDRYSEYQQNEFYQYGLIDSIRGIATAIKNIPVRGNKEWHASPTVFINPLKKICRFSLFTVNHETKEIEREELNSGVLPLKEGRTSWPKGFYARGVATDVGLRYYDLSNYNESHFTINKIDFVERKIYFSFDVYCDNDEVKARCSEQPENCWAKNINFLGGRGVVDFPK